MALDTNSGLPADDEVTIRQPGPAAAEDEPVYATTDLLIQRTDLGEGIWTIIAADSCLPPHLVRFRNMPYQRSVTLDGRRRRNR